MKKPILIILLLFITIGALTLTRSVVATTITTSGLELSKVQEETNNLRTENAILREEIYTLSALTSISKRAEKIGFEQSASVYAVSGAQTIARGE